MKYIHIVPAIVSLLLSVYSLPVEAKKVSITLTGKVIRTENTNFKLGQNLKVQTYIYDDIVDYDDQRGGNSYQFGSKDITEFLSMTGYDFCNNYAKKHGLKIGKFESHHSYDKNNVSKNHIGYHFSLLTKNNKTLDGMVSCTARHNIKLKEGNIDTNYNSYIEFKIKNEALNSKLYNDSIYKLEITNINN